LIEKMMGHKIYPAVSNVTMSKWSSFAINFSFSLPNTCGFLGFSGNQRGLSPY
jgi:hypothetical protein